MALRGSPTPGTQSSPKERMGSAASVMLLRQAMCVKGLAVRQIAWYQRSAERVDHWSAMNGPDHDQAAEKASPSRIGADAALGRLASRPSPPSSGALLDEHQHVYALPAARCPRAGNRLRRSRRPERAGTAASPGPYSAVRIDACGMQDLVPCLRRRLGWLAAPRQLARTARPGSGASSGDTLAQGCHHSPFGVKMPFAHSLEAAGRSAVDASAKIASDCRSTKIDHSWPRRMREGAVG